MTEDGAAAGMEIDTAAPSPSITPVTAAASGTVQQGADKSKPRFEIKKYNAVALWAWGKFSYLYYMSHYAHHSAGVLTSHPSLLAFAPKLRHGC